MRLTETSIGQPVTVFYSGTDPYLKQFQRKTGVIIAIQPDPSSGVQQGLVELEIEGRPEKTTQVWLSERYLSPAIT